MKVSANVPLLPACCEVDFSAQAKKVLAKTSLPPEHAGFEREHCWK
jgi:hypothetical protein